MAERKRRTYGSGSVYPYRGRWAATVRLPDGKRREVYADSEAGAKRALKDLQAALAGNEPRPSPKTLAAWLDEWLRGVAARTVRPSTLGRYRLDVDRWSLALGSVRLAALTVDQVQTQLARWRASDLSDGSVHNARAVLRTALAEALRQQLIPRNVAALVRARQPQRQSYPTITPEIARRMLDALADTPLAAPVTLALATGLRRGELLGLRWEDCDLDRPSITVAHQQQRRAGAYELAPLKTERSQRTLVLPAVAVEALRGRKRQQAEDRLRAGARWADTLGLVFTTPLGAPRNGGSLTHAFAKALAAAGLPHVRWHDLRHGAAALLLVQGASMRVVMEQLGHSTISVTMNTYAGVAPELMRDAADRLDQALTRPQNSGR